jgi:hypothetical protein
MFFMVILKSKFYSRSGSPSRSGSSLARAKQQKEKVNLKVTF